MGEGACTHVAGELGGHGADAASAVDDDERLLLRRAAEGDEVEVAREHLPRGEPDEGQRRGVGVAPRARLAARDARVDGGVLRVRARAAEHAREDDLVARAEQGVRASVDDDS